MRRIAGRATCHWHRIHHAQRIRRPHRLPHRRTHRIVRRPRTPRPHDPAHRKRIARRVSVAWHPHQSHRHIRRHRRDIQRVQRPRTKIRQHHQLLRSNPHSQPRDRPTKHLSSHPTHHQGVRAPLHRFPDTLVADNTVVAVSLPYDRDFPSCLCTNRSSPQRLRQPRHRHRHNRHPHQQQRHITQLQSSRRQQPRHVDETQRGERGHARWASAEQMHQHRQCQHGQPQPRPRILPAH